MATKPVLLVHDGGVDDYLSTVLLFTMEHVRGVNPFPPIFRRDSFTIDHLPILNQTEKICTPLAPEPGPEFIAKILRAESEPVTILR